MDAITLFLNAIDHWRDNKGVGTALIPPPLIDKAMILGVLQKFYDKRESASVLIVCNNFTERRDIIEYLTTQEDTENNEEFTKLIDKKSIKILTQDYIENVKYKNNSILTILYHIESMSDYLIDILSNSKFRLVILNNTIPDNKLLLKVYSISPLLPDFKQTEIDILRTTTPVKEIRIGVDIPADTETYKLLQYYDEYIATSINIFGSFNNIEYARLGDKNSNISASQFCYNLALENGWNEHLDMSIEYNVQIDDLYNPANIRDRATQTYEIIRNRRSLLCNYEAKLETILNIVKEHKDKHILIINKYGEFASKVTEYLNNMSETDVCGNYHDNVDPIPATTIEGNPIFVKSGPHKGERRMLAAKAQRSFNEERFNAGYINVLSTNNSPDKDLNIPVDIVIITSPECEDIESYLYRLSNIRPNSYIRLYSIYVTNSAEEKKLQNKTLSETHIIEENVKNENNCNFIIAD